MSCDLELLRRAVPDHPAIMTDHLDWFENSTPPKIDPPAITNALADEIAQLNQLDVDLLLYLLQRTTEKFVFRCKRLQRIKALILRIRILSAKACPSEESAKVM